MARGKKLQTETMDESEIVDMLDNDDESAQPNFLITDDYGGIVQQKDYALVKRVLANRTGTKTDGENEGKVIKYYKWQKIAYVNSVFSVLQSYERVANAEKLRKLSMCKDYKIIGDIMRETQEEINNCIRQLGMTDNMTNNAKMIDDLKLLHSKLNQVNKVLEEADEFHELIKEKRQILIKDIEPKKHRTPKEKE